MLVYGGAGRAMGTTMACSRYMLQVSTLLLMLVVSSSLAFLLKHRYEYHLRRPSFPRTYSNVNSVVGPQPSKGAPATVAGRWRIMPVQPKRHSCRQDCSLMVLEVGNGAEERSPSKKKRGGKKRGGRGAGASAGSGRGGGGRGKGASETGPLEEQWGGESRRSAWEQPVKNELSRNIDPSELTRKAKYFTVEASEEECALLSKRFSVESISSLKAEMRVLRASGRDSRKIKIKGKLVSDVIQLCAASLKPFDLAVNKEFDTVIQEVSLDSVDSTLWALDTDSEADDEIMEGDPLDIGEVAAQTLALCINPFATHPDYERGGFDFRKISVTDFDLEETIARRADAIAISVENSRGRGGERGMFAPESEEDDVVMDNAAMRAFFDDDDD